MRTRKGEGPVSSESGNEAPKAVGDQQPFFCPRFAAGRNEPEPKRTSWPRNTDFGTSTMKFFFEAAGGTNDDQ
jgi:hypothetical protein